eukprot:6638924-Alexandrium_andersonii.AAC.1
MAPGWCARGEVLRVRIELLDRPASQAPQAVPGVVALPHGLLDRPLQVLHRDLVVAVAAVLAE